MNTERPDVNVVMAQLKDFQRATVEHVHRRLWVDQDAVRRFLVADEVGLGKTLVARGVIAKTIDHLWETVPRIDVVYICSNSQIARQNLGRLSVVEGHDLDHADRLTLLPTVMGELHGRKLNFVSFTPGTSFHVGDSGGKAPERVLLYWLMAAIYGRDSVRPRRWQRFFQGGVREDRFQAQLKSFDRTNLDDTTVSALAQELQSAQGPRGGLLVDEIEACVDEFNYLRGKPGPELSRRRNRLIGALRHLVARAAVHSLKPDLVILDEFQRFKDLLDPEQPGADLAHALFDHPDAKMLLLSATPYKMYTLPDEPEGDDHYRDFFRTVEFLADSHRRDRVEGALRTMRETLLADGDLTRAREAKEIAESELRRVMSRTERLASSPDRDGMLVEQPLPGVRLTADDVRAYRSVDDIVRLIDRHDVFEYWRSAPYLYNLMENYQVKKKLRAHIDRQDPAVIRALRSSTGLLSWRDLQQYNALDPGNAKMRGLVGDTLDRGAWRLAWLPPSMPYYDLAGAYAQPQLRGFTKRLVFSAWAVVPKAIATVMSYEAERRALEGSGSDPRPYDARRATGLLRFQRTEGRLTGMPVLGLLYPSAVLAELGDPVALARHVGDQLPADRQLLLDAAKTRIAAELNALPPGNAEKPAGVDQRWYWAAPFLLDERKLGQHQADFLGHMLRWGNAEEDGSTQNWLRDHVRAARDIDPGELGPRPPDLVDVLARTAVAGPGICSLRALSRVSGGAEVLRDRHTRDCASTVSWGLRSLFNRPETMTLLRADERDSERYWRAVLDHCLDGGLQAVLDEYAHVLVESEGLQDADGETRTSTIAQAAQEALSLRAAANTVDDFHVTGEQATIATHRVRAHLAARFGRGQSDDQAVVRESHIRTAYNSPFWPFVLASTSVGQEGLDFHTYSHAVVHWNLPSNPVDLEQREGRVHRYKGHAVRKNIARHHGRAAFHATVDDPWYAMFLAAVDQRDPQASDLTPFWVYATPDGAKIERYVPALPLSREEQQHRRLLRTVGAYRLVVGQPRQDELLRYLGDEVASLDWLRIDLTPASGPPTGTASSRPGQAH